ncbi:hypothetical protein DM860_013437 [Cuscuta australis]|uniref:Uncharacterized protein n=1 Tax=Cuscuta australis TaxID=267555 RepID=A0A328D003_9ASTE|nr:hypothetical protein DM860_013437 [Cuscuta australis]
MEEDIDAAPRAPIPGIGSTLGDSSAPKKTKGRGFREEAAEAEHSARLSARFDSLVSHGDPGSERYLLNDDVLVESSGGCSTEGHNIGRSSMLPHKVHLLLCLRKFFLLQLPSVVSSPQGILRSFGRNKIGENKPKIRTRDLGVWKQSTNHRATIYYSTFYWAIPLIPFYDSAHELRKKNDKNNLRWGRFEHRFKWCEKQLHFHVRKCTCVDN